MDITTIDKDEFNLMSIDKRKYAMSETHREYKKNYSRKRYEDPVLRERIKQQARERYYKKRAAILEQREQNNIVIKLGRPKKYVIE
jgi:hypothetical protein